MVTESTNVVDTAEPTLMASELGSEPPNEPRADTRRRRRWATVKSVVLGLVVVVAIAASLVRLPYYRIAPGNVYDTIEGVGAPADRVTIPEGDIGFVTISQTADISALQWLEGQVRSHVDIKHEDDINNGQTTEERRAQDQRRMQVSKSAAVVVALERLGHDLVVTPLGVEVAQVFDCSGAEGELGTGDVIIGLGDSEVRDPDDLHAALSTHSIGDGIELLVERIDPNNPAQSLKTEPVDLTLGSADAACLADDVRAEEPRPFIGIAIAPLVDEQLPFEVDIETGQVGGPSAGLAFTLAIIDVLSQGELTNGLKVVATGTIDRAGNVGPVGGIHQKTIAAEDSGADVFLVPVCCENFVDLPSNYDEAVQYAEHMQVVGIETLDDALRALGALGGDVERFLS